MITGMIGKSPKEVTFNVFDVHQNDRGETVMFDLYAMVAAFICTGIAWGIDSYKRHKKRRHHVVRRAKLQR